MSIASEITRLQSVKSNILDAIAAKGISVPSGAMLADCPNLISSISGGGGNNLQKVVISPSSSYAVLIDNNGYIGEFWRNDGKNVYALKNASADYSGKGLGKVTFPTKIISQANINGRTYKTTRLGNKEFICCNLKEIFDFDLMFNDATIPQCCYWNNDPNNEDYGFLYNGWAATEINNKLTNGWRVAERDDFLFLKNNYDYVEYLYNINGWGDKDYFKTDFYELNISPYGYAYGSEWAGGYGFKGFGINNTWWATNIDSSNKQQFSNALYNSMMTTNSFEPRTNYFYIRLVRDIAG